MTGPAHSDRPRVIDALQSLVGEIKSHCVVEQEIYD